MNKTNFSITCWINDQAVQVIIPATSPAAAKAYAEAEFGPVLD